MSIWKELCDYNITLSPFIKYLQVPREEFDKIRAVVEAIEIQRAFGRGVEPEVDKALKALGVGTEGGVDGI